MNYAVEIIQEINYKEHIIATFESFEEAAIFANTVLRSCAKSKCSISLIEEGEDEN